jgi:hypothetical protein
MTTPADTQPRPTVCHQEGTTEPAPWHHHPAFVASLSLLSGVALIGGLWIAKDNLEKGD